MTPGERIAQARRKYHITQWELASMLNWDRKKVQRIESGRTQLNEQSILMLCRSLHLTPNQLLGFDDK